MTTTLEDLKAKHAAEIAALEADAALRAKIPVDPNHTYHYSDHWYVSYLAADLPAARAILALYAPGLVVSEHWNRGCSERRPARINKYAKEAGATLQGTSAVELRLSGGRGYGPDAALEFWAEVGGELVIVSVKIPANYLWLPAVRTRYDSHGNCVESVVTPRSLGEDSRTKWWSPPSSYQISYYWADLHNFSAWGGK